jgi:MFS family permease
MYAFFDTLPFFIFIEIYSGFIGSIQNTILTSYTLDVVPEGHRAEYISILNGFNGAIYFTGALTGGYLLSLFIDFFPLRLALTFSYLIVFSGRFISSFLFRGLKEVEGGGRNNGVLRILFKPRQPGSPSGGPISPR